MDGTVGKVTDDVSASTNNDVFGVAVAAVTVAYYAWFQLSGRHTAVKAMAAPAISDNALLAGSTSSDGCIIGISTTATASLPMYYVGKAIALKGAGSTTISAVLNIQPH
jgi:hypothetical protein